MVFDNWYNLVMYYRTLPHVDYTNWTSNKNNYPDTYKTNWVFKNAYCQIIYKNAPPTQLEKHSEQGWIIILRLFYTHLYYTGAILNWSHSLNPYQLFKYTDTIPKYIIQTVNCTTKNWLAPSLGATYRSSLGTSIWRAPLPTLLHK